MSQQLYQYIANHMQKHNDAVLQEFSKQIRKILNQSVTGIVFYGSCMRSRIYEDGMLDFYVFVENYSNAYSNHGYRIGNYLLPPNVFYLQVESNKKIYRCKYAVISQAEMDKAVKAFHSYFWARFCQPIASIYAKDSSFNRWMAETQCVAAKSFYQAVMPVLINNKDSQSFWIKGFELTYAAELRAESKQRAELIYRTWQQYYDGMFALIMDHKNVTPHYSTFNQLKWKTRIILGKVLSILRLMKATATFAGGVDYIAWKIARHTGQPVAVDNKMRKYPWIFCWPVIYRLFKQGKIR